MCACMSKREWETHCSFLHLLDKHKEKAIGQIVRERKWEREETGFSLLLLEQGKERRERLGLDMRRNAIKRSLYYLFIKWDEVMGMWFSESDWNRMCDFSSGQQVINGHVVIESAWSNRDVVLEFDFLFHYKGKKKAQEHRKENAQGKLDLIILIGQWQVYNWLVYWSQFQTKDSSFDIRLGQSNNCRWS